MDGITRPLRGSPVRLLALMRPRSSVSSAVDAQRPPQYALVVIGGAHHYELPRLSRSGDSGGLGP